MNSIEFVYWIMIVVILLGMIGVAYTLGVAADKRARVRNRARHDAAVIALYEKNKAAAMKGTPENLKDYRSTITGQGKDKNE